MAQSLHCVSKATLQDLTEEWQSLQVPFAPQSFRGLATKISAMEAVWYRSLAVGEQSSKLFCDAFWIILACSCKIYEMM